ncbi:MAG TPA: YbhB/YbcL family Raf kinase inhibitor-like protein [Solirubrobacteraceae bacterium]|jgi:hypothetical protein
MMGRLANIATSGALMLALVLAGCGGSSSTSKSSSASASTGQTASAGATTQTSGGATGGAQSGEQTPKTSASKEHLPKVTILMSSPAFHSGAPIAARYTCDGADMSPPIRWSAIPHGTAELALFILNLNSPAGGGPLIYWAVAGLHPTLHGIAAGKLPAGAIVGRNSLGQSRYTICPAKSDGAQQYVVALFALQHPVAAAPGFNADALYKTASNAAEDKGLMGFSYQRK